MGKWQCMEGQIDLVSYRARIKRTQKNQFRRKTNEKSGLPFRLIIFQKAYIALKKDGEINSPDVLEFRKPSRYEIYESLYLSALQKVYMYCKVRCTDEYQIELLTYAYEQEFDWMVQRYNMLHKQSNTA